MKQLSQHVTAIFKLFHNIIKSYHDKSRFFSGVNAFWVVDNNQRLLNSIEKINKRSSAKSITTFDFSTLYTKIPHDDLLDVLMKIIDFAFSGGARDKISIDHFGNAQWDKNPDRSKVYFTKESLKDAVAYLINNCYFTIGEKVLRQVIGIPMGLDPAPFIANLYLQHYEAKWLKLLSKSDSIRARKFGNIFRFQDDLNAINDGGEFERCHNQI